MGILDEMATTFSRRSAVKDMLLTFLQIFILLGALQLTGIGTATAEVRPAASFNLQITALDPGTGTSLAAGDRLYLRVSYQSPVPVRFVPEGFRQGTVQDAAVTSSTPPYSAGRNEALTWILYNSTVGVDELRVTAYDLSWKPLGRASEQAHITWEQRDSFEPREPAAWVEPLARNHRRVFDSSYDPQPEQPHPVFDFFFVLCFMAIPGYLLMQFQMLARYRGKWQWYAAAPLLPIIPLGLYSLLGLGLSADLWVIFLFRYLAVAFLYLLILWTVVWKRERKTHRQLRQNVDATSGKE